MDEYKLKLMIENILKGQCKKKVFLILDKSDVYVDEVFKVLKKYEDVEYKYVESEDSLDSEKLDCIRYIADKLDHDEDIEDFIEGCDLVVIPFLSKSTLAKVSLGIADDVVSHYAQVAIMMNKNIVALDTLFNPNTEYNRIKKRNLNGTYNSMILKYCDTLQGFGVVCIPVYELEDKINRSLYVGRDENHACSSSVGNECIEDDDSNEVIDKKYITMKDIDGKDVLCISKNSKLTHLAQEYVLENKINVIEK